MRFRLFRKRKFEEDHEKAEEQLSVFEQNQTRMARRLRRLELEAAITRGSEPKTPGEQR